jgi:thioredoxin reductase
MKQAQTVIIGAGPAGLAAAIEVAKAGGTVTLIDENIKPGGQLFKQIHKFFGSGEHLAGIRGFDIGEKLLSETKGLGVEVLLNAPVYAIFPDRTIMYSMQGKERSVQAEKIIIATGAVENALAFPGSTLPGVMGAGAAQTMVNVNRVLPGRNILMVGSGNVGLIVSYQLMQAGAGIVGLVDAASSIGGYGVHAAKLRRAGVPFYLSHTIKKVIGSGEVEKVEIVELDSKWRPLPGTEKVLKADTVCIAVGLTPLAELAWMLGCEFIFIPALGGHVPKHNADMETSVPGIYVAGDITGVEEASTAMEEGRLAGIAAAEALGLYKTEAATGLKEMLRKRLEALRSGTFGEKRKEAKKKLIESFPTG